MPVMSGGCILRLMAFQSRTSQAIEFVTLTAPGRAPLADTVSCPPPAQPRDRIATRDDRRP
jgi:hypothetical protein